jgi:hypothetical protein
MNRVLRSLLLAGGAVLLLAGSGGTAVRAAAESTTTPFETVIPDPCTGEDVLVSGSLHTVGQAVQDAHGGFHINGHITLQGISGVGLSTGTTYHWTGGARINVHYGCGVDCSPPYEQTSGSNFQLIGQGSAPDEQVHALTHITVNANGELTANVQEFRMTCR